MEDKKKRRKLKQDEQSCRVVALDPPAAGGCAPRRSQPGRMRIADPLVVLLELLVRAVVHSEHRQTVSPCTSAPDRVGQRHLMHELPRAGTSPLETWWQRRGILLLPEAVSGALSSRSTAAVRSMHLDTAVVGMAPLLTGDEQATAFSAAVVSTVRDPGGAGFSRMQKGRLLRKAKRNNAQGKPPEFTYVAPMDCT